MKHARFGVLATLILVSACESPDGPTSSYILAPRFVAHLTNAWGPATRLAGSASFNTTALEGCPAASPDGQSIYFASNRAGDNDIYVAHRSPDGAWGDPEQLPKGVNAVNSAANDYCPTPLPGGTLMFVSERNDGQNCGPAGTADIYETRYDPARGWLAPTHLGCTVNSPAHEFSPSLVPAGGGVLFFSSNRAGFGGRHAIYASARGPDGEWQEPAVVEQLSMAGYDTFRPNVSADGRTVVFDSNRPGSTGLDIWYSTRATPHAAWDAPTRFDAGPDAINSAANETRASLSRDGRRLYFGSNRDGVSFDIYVAERR